MCIFCKLANGEIPTNKVYEDDYVTAILDANPTSNGHVIILTKKHFANIIEADKETINHVGIAIKKIGNALLKTYGIALNVLSNINEEAGQTVMHAHIHLIPVNENGNKANISFNEIVHDDFETVKNNIINNI